MNGCALALALALVGAAGSPAEVSYRLDFVERAAHRANIEMVVQHAAAPLELWMPIWTPGAYEVRTWGKNVTPLSAEDGNGRALRFWRSGPSTFRVDGHAAGGPIKLRYRVHASLLSDDASQVDESHAYLNGTSIFLAAQGKEQLRHLIHLDIPAGWSVASPLNELPAGGWEAPNYEQLIDAPMEVGRFASAVLQAAGRTYQLAIDGASSVPPAFLRDFATIVEHETRLIGPPPYRRYLFLVHLADSLGRVAALEHSNAASVLVPRRYLSENDGDSELLFIAAHELFHAWNARRLRPRELWPYDLLHVQPSRSLWITEGITEYYAYRTLRLSGKWSPAHYLERLSQQATRAFGAARLGRTIEEDAELTWQPPDDAAADPDAYYARGHLVALALDASIRTSSHGLHTLDEVLRALLAAAEQQAGVLAIDGQRLASEIAKVAGPSIAELVQRWTQEPHELPRVGEALAKIGLELRCHATCRLSEVQTTTNSQLREALLGP